jgi:4-amino-4-deoxy-L-arabinose transferase-like glycosyltransferase
MTENLAAPVLRPLAEVPVGRARRIGDWLTTHARTIALVAVGLSLVISGGYALVLGGELRFYDEQVYVGMVHSMAGGHGVSLDGVQPTAYRPPGYLFLLLPVYLVTGGSVLAMRLVGVLALTGSVWFVYLLGRRAHSPATGALAALVVACYPLLVFTATTLYPQVPALFLLLLLIELAFRALPGDGLANRRRLGAAVLAGLVGGLLTLTVPTFGVTAIGLVAYLAWRQRSAAGRIAWRTVAVLIVATALLPVLWCARNAVQLHAFVPVSTNDGVNLLLGNSPNATPDSGTNADISAYARAAAARHLGEVDQDHFFTSQATDWIKHNPGQALALYGGKVANNFSYSDNLATTGQRGGAQDLVSALSYYPILLLALLRIALLRRWRPRPSEKLVIGVIVVNVLLLAVFFTRLRFRVPLDALTIVLAASAVTHYLSRHASHASHAGHVEVA